MTTATAYEVHPLAELIPAMSDAEYRELREDIEANGLRQSITLYEGKVLDGRHRARACGELGIEPTVFNYEGDEPAAYVLSLNVKRRNLTKSQLSMIGADFLPHLEAELRKSSRQGQRTDMAPPLTSAPDGAEVISPAAKEAAKPSKKAARTAAESVGVGARSVQRAKRIQERDPEVAQMVRQGSVTTTQAEEKITGRPNNDRSNGLATELDARGRRQPATYFGKGDKWKESTEPLTRYLAAWGRRGYEFAHVNPAEARKRVKRIDDLMAGLEAARADLEPRTQKAKLTL